MKILSLNEMNAVSGGGGYKAKPAKHYGKNSNKNSNKKSAKNSAKASRAPAYCPPPPPMCY